MEILPATKSNYKEYFARYVAYLNSLQPDYEIEPSSFFEQLFQVCEANYLTPDFVDSHSFDQIIFLVNDSHEVLCITVMDTPDMGTLVSLFPGDTFNPPFQEAMLDIFETWGPKFNIELLQEGRGEYVLQTNYDDFAGHLKDLSVVKRCWNRCEKKYLTAILKGEELQTLLACHVIDSSMTESNFRYFHPDAQSENFPTINDTMLLAQVTVPKFAVSIMQDGALIGFGIFLTNKNYDEHYWVNSVFYRNAETKADGVGNYIILKALQYIYTSSSYDLNLGLDIFEYKKIWKPEHVMRRGLRLATNGS